MADEKKGQENPFEINVVRTIGKTEEVWDPDEKDETTGEKRGSMFSLEDRLGTIELELSGPLQLSDREEPATSVYVNAPTGDDIEQTKGTARTLMRRCVVGINPKDLGKLHGMDYIKLQGLIRHFLSST